MLSQKIKEKLETEGICNCVVISIRDDIEEQDRGYLAALKEVKALKSQLESMEVAIITRDNALMSLEILQRENDKLKRGEK